MMKSSVCCIMQLKCSVQKQSIIRISINLYLYICSPDACHPLTVCVNKKMIKPGFVPVTHLEYIEVGYVLRDWLSKSILQNKLL